MEHTSVQFPATATAAEAAAVQQADGRPYRGAHNQPERFGGRGDWLVVGRAAGRLATARLGAGTILEAGVWK